MANEIGSALIIPDSVLKQMGKADEKLQALQNRADQVAKAVSAAFSGMAKGTNPFVTALDTLNGKLQGVSKAAESFSASMSNVKSGGIQNVTRQAENLTASISRAAQNIDRMSGKSPDNGGLQASVKNWTDIGKQIDSITQRQERLSVIMRDYELNLQRIRNGKSGTLDVKGYDNAKKEYEANLQVIASLRQKQQAIVVNNQALAQQRAMLDGLKNYKSDSGSLDNLRSKDTLAQMRAYYTELEKSSAKEAQARQKEAEEFERAEQRKQKAIAQTSKAQQAWEQSQRKQTQSMYDSVFSTGNASYKSAMTEAGLATSINQRTQAIKMLQAARANLNSTDKDYASNLTALNAKIKELNAANRQAVAGSMELQSSHRGLLNTTEQLSRAFALMFSVSQIRSYIANIAQVRGEFEMSQRSLEAILQNKTKADEIFGKTVELAVKSPFRIKDLVSYTKQLAAYRIESDDLYDTTKRLADVSAGLGVDMGRLILAYGQVKAAAYLRGTEVRQFTEAGINMYGELQQYFKEVKGEAYTTAQIVDMISKRQVTFQDVEQVFKRMTDQGGLFYNMQEIQAETLQGKISNLKDSVDVMMNEIGKANEGTFKGMISGATEMLSNWKTILNVAKLFAGVLASIYITTKLTNGAWGQTAANIMASHQKLGVFKALLSALSGGTGRLSSAFAALGSTVMASLPLAALTAAIALVQELISVSREYNEAMSQNTKEYYTAQVRVDEIDAESKTDIQKALQDLVKEMNQKGFEIKINVNLSEEEAKKQYSELLSDYQEFLNEILVIDARYAANKKKGWLIGDDDIETDMKEYSSSLGEFLSKGEEIRYILAQVSKESTNLTDSQRKMFEQLAAGPQKGQNLIDYYSKVAKALEQIGYIKDGIFGNKQNMVGILGGTGNNGYDWGIGTDADKQLSEFAMAYETYIKDLEEVRKEARSVFGDVSKYQDEASKKRLKILIDNEAIKRGWGDIEKDMLYKEYKINVNIDKNKAQKQIDGIKTQMDRAFANNTYHITFTYDPIVLNPDEAYNEFDKEAQAKLKRLQSLVTKRHNLKGGTMRLAGYSEAATTREINDIYKDISQLGQGYKEAANQIMGYNKARTRTSGRSTKSEKQQRDILQERISLLKDMNSKYNDLIKTESKESALSKTRGYFKDAARYVGWNANDILPDDASVAKRIRELGKTAKDIAKKGGYMRIAADIEWNISKEEYDKMKDDISRNIDDAFSSLSLYRKLKGTGLGDLSIKGMFGDVAKSFNDIRTSIDDEFNKYITRDYEEKYGKDFAKWGDKIIRQHNADLENTANVLKARFAGSDIYKEYLSQTQKLDKQIYDQSVSDFEELTKAYKTRLDDQLQLDLWYAEERRKIQENTNLANDKDLQREYEDNLTKQYNQKTDENTWKQFQNSDYYIRIFENLEGTSTRMLNSMSEKLASLRESLKNLSPEQLKQIIDAQEKVDALANTRNPFKALGKGLGDYIKNLKKRKELEKEIVKGTKRQDELNKELQLQNRQTDAARKVYESIVLQEGPISTNAQLAKRDWELQKNKLATLKQQKKATDEQIKSQTQGLNDIIKLNEQTKAALGKVGSYFGDAADIIKSTFDALNDWGIAVEMPPELQEIVGGFEKIDSSISQIVSGKVISGTINLIGGIGKTLGGIFGWGTKDAKLEKKIQKMTQQVEDLQKAYDRLKESMDNAWNSDKLLEYSHAAQDNLKAQIANYEAMIRAEESKKKTDKDKIKQWQDSIDETKKSLDELKESQTEAFGGFGTEENFKSAAEAFSEAWVNAFNEGSDALEALEDKFNDYFDNLLVKQITQRAAESYIKPILDAFDSAVAEGSEGGHNGTDVTEDELDRLKALKDKNLAAYNEYLENMMKILGVSPTGSTESNLSKLQQGIQSVSEQTAQALESILNSMRFFLATQQGDVAVIKNMLTARFATSGGTGQDGNPMLVELRSQTGYLRRIADNWDRVMKAGHPSGGYGLKVIM